MKKILVMISLIILPLISFVNDKDPTGKEPGPEDKRVVNVCQIIN